MHRCQRLDPEPGSGPYRTGRVQPGTMGSEPFKWVSMPAGRMPERCCVYPGIRSSVSARLNGFLNKYQVLPDLLSVSFLAPKPEIGWVPQTQPRFYHYSIAEAVVLNDTMDDLNIFNGYRFKVEAGHIEIWIHIWSAPYTLSSKSKMLLAEDIFG